MSRGGAVRPAARRPTISIVVGMKGSAGAVKGALALLAGSAALDCPLVSGQGWFPAEKAFHGAPGDTEAAVDLEHGQREVATFD